MRASCARVGGLALVVQELIDKFGIFLHESIVPVADTGADLIKAEDQGSAVPRFERMYQAEFNTGASLVKARGARTQGWRKQILPVGDFLYLAGLYGCRD